MKRALAVSLLAAVVILGVAVAPSLATTARKPLTPAQQARVNAFAFRLQHGYMVGDVAHYIAVKKAALAAVAGQHPANAPTTALDPIARQSFEGAYDTSGDPPDTTGAVGPQSYVEAVNSRMDIFSKTGTHIGGNTFEGVMGACHSSAAVCEYSDPQVLYDMQTKRFYWVDLNADIGGSDNFFVWGFSKTSAPTAFDNTQWCNYSADFGYGTTLPDYPKLGQSTAFLMIGVNDYVGEAYQGADLDTISKPQTVGPITTCPAASSFKLKRTGPISDCNPSGVFAANLNPAQQADPRPVGWVVADPDPSNSGYSANWVDIIKVTKDPTTGDPVVHPAQCVSVPMYGPPPPAPQKINPPSPTFTIDTLDGRLTHAVIAVDPRIPARRHHRMGLWTSHAVQGGAGSEVDWYEIDVSRATAFQQGRIMDANLWVYNGAIASDRRPIKPASGKFGSNMVAGFTTSSPNDYPAIQMVSQIADGPQSAFVMIKASPGPDLSFSCPQNPVFPGKCRWGDYSGAVPDFFAPKTGATGAVWLSNQWVTGEDGTNPITGGPTWRTQIWQATP